MSIFDVPLSEIRDPNELAHFGVKGMKWGRRRAKKRSEIKARIAKQGRAIVIQKARSNRRWPERSPALVMPGSETATRMPARPGSGTGRTTTMPATEAASLASMFGSDAGSASED